jgi:AcrR family transcriptional regulator
MTRPDAKARLAEAAFELFAERGYDGTTVDDIAERAACGRATFFRHYRSKEDVVLPDHESLLGQVRARLESSNQETALAAVSDAVRIVLLNYLAEGDRAKIRYTLTSSVPALRDREIASVAPYQRLFREFIWQWMGSTTDAPLRAELMSAAVVAAHNHVLRRWLRGDSVDPAGEVDDAMKHVLTLFSTSSPAKHADVVGHQEGEDFTVVVAFRSHRSLAQLVPDIEKAVRRP